LSECNVFPKDPRARSDFRAGALYAIWGIGDGIYYGQMAADKSVGFFARRDREIAGSAEVLASPIMSRVTVSFPSIGRALRAGVWKKLGKYPLRDELAGDQPVVQWSWGTTLDVTVWIGRVQSLVTRVEDPSIQDFEVMSVWDAIEHIPDRLAMDYAPNEASTVTNAWSIGGPVWRQRRVKEEFARRFPDNHAHQLPADWVPARRMV
jgi:hypothetical protein